MAALAANRDHRKVQANGRAGSVGAQSAFRRREPDDDLLRTVMGHLADRVASRLRGKQRAGRTVTVRVRFAGMMAVTLLSRSGSSTASPGGRVGRTREGRGNCRGTRPRTRADVGLCNCVRPLD